MSDELEEEKDALDDDELQEDFGGDMPEDEELEGSEDGEIFDEDDDELPSFFLDEPLPPTGKMARLRSSEVNAAMQNLLDAHSG